MGEIYFRQVKFEITSPLDKWVEKLVSYLASLRATHKVVMLVKMNEHQLKIVILMGMHPPMLVCFASGLDNQQLFEGIIIN